MPTKFDNRSKFLREFLEEHERSLKEKNYPLEIYWELKETAFKYACTWLWND